MKTKVCFQEELETDFSLLEGSKTFRVHKDSAVGISVTFTFHIFIQFHVGFTWNVSRQSIKSYTMKPF